METKTAAVSMRNISKSFFQVKANYNVNLDIYKGEILSLLGENGSGKTTLMNMLSGIYYPDGGEILINGQPAMIHSPKEAFDYGIGMIHQHFKLVDVFTATENIILGLHDTKRLDLAAAEKKAKSWASSCRASSRAVFALFPAMKAGIMTFSSAENSGSR